MNILIIRTFKQNFRKEEKDFDNGTILPCTFERDVRQICARDLKPAIAMATVLRHP